MICARFLAAVVACICAVSPNPAKSASFSVHGVTFSDELGGFVIERVTGQGSLADPFVVVERMTSPTGGTLLFRADPAFGNSLGTIERIGFALTKVIENGTGVAWSGFELELQSTLGVPSDNTDELSFGQGSDAGRPFTSSTFSRVRIIDEPFDRIEYDEGSVPTGARTALRIVITQPSTLHEAYLVQRPGASGVESETGNRQGSRHLVEVSVPHRRVAGGSRECLVPASELPGCDHAWHHGQPWLTTSALGTPASC
jgi:hypothetical protein